MPRIHKASAFTRTQQSKENNRRSRKTSSNYNRPKMNTVLMDDILSDDSLSDFEPYTQSSSMSSIVSPNVMCIFVIYLSIFDIN